MNVQWPPVAVARLKVHRDKHPAYQADPPVRERTAQLLIVQPFRFSGSADRGCYRLRRSQPHDGVRTPEVRPLPGKVNIAGGIKTGFASHPISPHQRLLTFISDASSVVAVKHLPPWHIDAVEGRPPHQSRQIRCFTSDLFGQPPEPIQRYQTTCHSIDTCSESCLSNWRGSEPSRRRSGSYPVRRSARRPSS